MGRSRGESRARLHVETGLAAAGAALFVLTAAMPDWIEATFAVSPDAGSGAIEWLIASAFLAVAVVSGGLALRTLRSLGGPEGL